VVEARSSSSSTNAFQTETMLMIIPIREESGTLALGHPQVIASGVYNVGFSWSPSGHWLAVRHIDYRGGDKIYLVNPQQSSQTVDVVLADQIGQQMMSPIWSPDGKTLIVFSVAYGVSQTTERVEKVE
jgi:Tol biopolymer transport system component